MPSPEICPQTTQDRVMMDKSVKMDTTERLPEIQRVYWCRSEEIIKGIFLGTIRQTKIMEGWKRQLAKTFRL